MIDEVTTARLRSRSLREGKPKLDVCKACNSLEFLDPIRYDYQKNLTLYKCSKCGKVQMSAGICKI